MSRVWYWAMIEQHDGEHFVSIPDLPGPTAAAGTIQEALVLLAEFAADHVGDLVDRGGPVPPARDESDLLNDRRCERSIVPSCQSICQERQ